MSSCFWNTVRRRFGGRLHARNDGIKPFIQSVRQGYWGYYLPDQDHEEVIAREAVRLHRLGDDPLYIIRPFEYL